MTGRESCEVSAGQRRDVMRTGAAHSLPFPQDCLPFAPRLQTAWRSRAHSSAHLVTNGRRLLSRVGSTIVAPSTVYGTLTTDGRGRPRGNSRPNSPIHAISQGSSMVAITRRPRKSAGWAAS
eukprot:6879052-Prymnesium_polylepis.2